MCYGCSSIQTALDITGYRTATVCVTVSLVFDDRCQLGSPGYRVEHLRRRVALLFIAKSLDDYSIRSSTARLHQFRVIQFSHSGAVGLEHTYSTAAATAALRSRQFLRPRQALLQLASTARGGQQSYLASRLERAQTHSSDRVPGCLCVPFR